MPVLVVIQFVLTLGLGLFVAALNVRFRDTAVILEVILQAWFFLTPVVYAVHGFVVRIMGLTPMPHEAREKKKDPA